MYIYAMNKYIKIINSLQITDKKRFENFLKAYRNFDSDEVGNIINACSAVAGYDIVESRKRTRLGFLHRMIAYKLLYDNTNNNISDIARIMKRNHATVLHGLNSFQAEINYPDTQKYYKQIIKLIEL